MIPIQKFYEDPRWSLSKLLSHELIYYLKLDVSAFRGKTQFFSKYNSLLIACFTSNRCVTYNRIWRHHCCCYFNINSSVFSMVASGDPNARTNLFSKLFYLSKQLIVADIFYLFSFSLWRKCLSNANCNKLPSIILCWPN